MSEKRVWNEGSSRVVACVVWLTSLSAGGAALAQTTEGVDDVTPPGLVAHVEYGKDPNRIGFKLLLDGGEPFARGIVEVQGQGVAQAVRLPIQLDEAGGWSRVWRETPLPGSVSAQFKVLAASGMVVSSKVKISTLHQENKSPMQSGRIIVREIMKDPAAVSDSKGEWFELVNTTNQTIDLRKWVIDDLASNHHVIGKTATTPINLLPGVPFVLGNNSDPATNGGVTVHYKYSSFSLNNSADLIALYDPNGDLSDWVGYDDGIFWPDTAGRALNLKASIFDAAHADDGSVWCDASVPISATNPDHGTPGASNTTCP
ncbi:MAG: lamin tail domain-containing protein [Planctomycetes bacterium]|nr:lamin tail domain-containing protein [Planctomycetota bacterium]